MNTRGNKSISAFRFPSVSEKGRLSVRCMMVVASECLSEVSSRDAWQQHTESCFFFFHHFQVHIQQWVSSAFCLYIVWVDVYHTLLGKFWILPTCAHFVTIKEEKWLRKTFVFALLGHFLSALSNPGLSSSFFITLISASLDEVMFSFLAFHSLLSCFCRPLVVTWKRQAFSLNELIKFWLFCFQIQFISVPKNTTFFLFSNTNASFNKVLVSVEGILCQCVIKQTAWKEKRQTGLFI